jgi:hypothetical protein
VLMLTHWEVRMIEPRKDDLEEMVRCGLNDADSAGICLFLCYFNCFAIYVSTIFLKKSAKCCKNCLFFDSSQLDECW